MTRFALVAVVSAFTLSAFAAPVPKAKEKTDPTDLKKLHERVAEAVAKGDWSDADTTKVEEAVTATLAKLTASAGVNDRPLPVAFSGLVKKTPAELKAGLENALVIGDDVRATTLSNCVIVSSGEVKVTSITNCIVIARQVRCTGASNCVVLADEYARATSWGGGKRGDCVVIAGERVRASSMTGGFVHVLRPGTGTLPADDRREDKPIVMTSARGVTFFGREEKLSFADKDSKWVELKAMTGK